MNNLEIFKDYVFGDDELVASTPAYHIPSPTNTSNPCGEIYGLQMEQKKLLREVIKPVYGLNKTHHLLILTILDNGHYKDMHREFLQKVRKDYIDKKSTKIIENTPSGIDWPDNIVPRKYIANNGSVVPPSQIDNFQTLEDGWIARVRKIISRILMVK